MKTYQLFSSLLIMLLTFALAPIEAGAIPNRIDLRDPNLSYENLDDASVNNSSGQLTCYQYNKSIGVAYLKAGYLKLTKSRRAQLKNLLSQNPSSSLGNRYKAELKNLKKSRKLCRSAFEGTPTVNSTPTSFVFPSALSDVRTQYENRMLKFGRDLCRFLNNNSEFDPLLAATYYDAAWVFYQIGDYTGDKYWARCAKRAHAVYSGSYVLPNNGFIPGFWLFPHGLAEHYMRTSEKSAKKALSLLKSNAAYARTNTALSETEDTEFSREVAYVIMTYLEADKIGVPAPSRLRDLLDQALVHIEDWTTGRAPYVRPFMVAITSQALIEYDELKGDARITPSIKKALDHIWTTCWNSDKKAFQYTDRNRKDGGTELAPDLNLLIAPAYAWYAQRTGDQLYAERAYEIYRGGIADAYLGNGKQYNQNYRWSLMGLRWLSAFAKQ